METTKKKLGKLGVRRNEVKSYETLGGVVHEAELEALLVEERFGQGAPQRVRRKRRLVAVLQLREQFLQKKTNKQTIIEQ